MQKRNPKRHAACFVDYLCSALGESRSTESHVYIVQGHNGRAVFLLFLFLALYSERFLPGLVHIVDDDASFRTAIERRLKKAGYEVATYPSAQHLLDSLPSENELGCILLDVRIPGLSVPELQGRLSEIGSILPIVFLTGYADVQTTVRAIKAGAEDVLTKPVSSVELLAAVEQALPHHEEMRGQRTQHDVVRAHIAKLTPREREVFELVIRGKT